MSQILYGAKHGRVIQVEIDWAKCGTEANYRAHLRRNEKPCDACRLASNRAVCDRRRRYRLHGMSADDPRHGTTTGYNVRGCRCEECRAAMTAYYRALRAPNSRLKATS